jgi:hypothetical protein
VWVRGGGAAVEDPAQQDTSAAVADTAAPAQNGSSSGGEGSQLNGNSATSSGGSLKLPPRPMRVPIIPSRRMRSVQGGSPASDVLQDDPAVLDNLEDEATPQRRPVAANRQ